MLATPPDEPIVQIQRVAHESCVHADIETDDIPAEVVRLERWVVMQAPTGQRPGFRGSQRWPPDGAASGQVARARSGSEPRTPPRRSAPPPEAAAPRRRPQ